MTENNGTGPDWGNTVHDPITAVMQWGEGEQSKENRPNLNERTQCTSGSPFLDDFIKRHHIEISSCDDWNGGTRLKLRHCPFNENHQGGSAALFVSSEGHIGFKCQHNSCAQKDWKAVRQVFEPDYGNKQENKFSSQSEPGQSQIIRIEDIPSLSSFRFDEILFVVPGLIARGAITMFSSDPGSGKSTLASAIGAAVSLGGFFAGIQTHKSSVLTLDRENSGAVVQERHRRCGISDGQNFRIWGPWLPEEAPPPDATCVMDWVAHNPDSLIVVDSFVRFLDGDENSSADTNRFMSRLRQITRLGAAVLLLHHTGKGESARNYRGSSDLSAAIDTGYKMTNLGDGKLEKLRLQAFKSRFLL